MDNFKKANESFCAVILAAGASRRMGKNKQLLPIGEFVMLEKVITNVLAHPFEKVYTVIGHQAKQIQEKILIDDSRFSWLYNDCFFEGQGTSLKLVLHHALQDFSNICIFLGDVPFIKAETVEQLLTTSTKLVTERTDTFLVRPTYRNIVGHPVFLGHMTTDLCKQIHGDQGIKSIREKIASKTIVPVDDYGVIFDIDTPCDYAVAKKCFFE